MENSIVKYSSILLLVVTAVSTENAQQQTPLLGCGNNDRLISLDKTLTPPSNISSFESFGSFAAVMVLNFGTNVETWCTHAVHVDRNIIIGFSEPVLITAILSSGTKETRMTSDSQMTNFTYYVTNFTLDYWTVENDTVTKYLVSSDLNTLIKFEEPFVAESIRLKPINWITLVNTEISSSVDPELVCLGVAIFGCLYSEAVEQCPTSEPPTTPTSEYEDTTTTCSTDSNTTNECVCDTSTSQATSNAVRQGPSVTTVVLASVLTTIFVGLIALVPTGVVVYVVYNKKKETGEHKRLHNQRSYSCADGGHDDTLRQESNKESTSTQGIDEHECKENPTVNDSSGSLSDSAQIEKASV